ncbi:hypothetical protein TNCV_2885161 [Trichonephila clavipes]|nr:hypothetical protein TNCV_2885161 [Trichonephila clavipes]
MSKKMLIHNLTQWRQQPMRAKAYCAHLSIHDLGLGDCDFVQKESDPVDDVTDEDENNNNESSKDPSNADAFSVLETAIERYEQQSECCPTQLLLDLAAKKRRCTMVQ